jgi:hypothetical protein
MCKVLCKKKSYILLATTRHGLDANQTLRTGAPRLHFLQARPQNSFHQIATCLQAQAAAPRGPFEAGNWKRM